MSLGVFIDADGNPYFAEVTFPPADPVPPPPTSEPTPEQLGYVTYPTPTDLSRYLCWPDFDQEQQASAQSHLERAVMMIRSYTRGKGFWPGQWLIIGPLREVVLSVAGRSLANPTAATRIAAGAYSATPGPDGWLLHERLILDGYRRRAA